MVVHEILDTNTTTARRGPAAILLISRDVSSDSIAIFVLVFVSIAQLSRGMLQRGYHTDAPV